MRVSAAITYFRVARAITSTDIRTILLPRWVESQLSNLVEKGPAGPNWDQCARLRSKAESDRRADTDRSGRKLRTGKIDPERGFVASRRMTGVDVKPDLPGGRSGRLETDSVYAVRRDAHAAGVRLRQFQNQEHRTGYAKRTERRHGDGRAPSPPRPRP